MRTVGRVLGVVLVLLGAVWILQGLNVLPGSFMTGQLFWAGAGAVAVVAGAIVLWLSARRAARS